MGIQCFFIHKTGFTHRYLRRYASNKSCTASGFGYCNAKFFIDKGIIGEASTTVKQLIDKEDIRWPKQCSCGYFFKEDDEWQLFIDPEYAKSDAENIFYTLENAPAGAMWNADWLLQEGSNKNRGPDGHCLVVRTPGGDWVIDGKASNCDRPDDDSHKCWVRHGIPPLITVDKNGATCGAGAGSIAIGKYHGHLVNGELT